MSLFPLKKLLKLFYFIIIFSTVVFSQVNSRSYKILGISVDGSKSADAGTIIANSGLKVGDEIQIPGDQTLNAIRQIWSLNIFSDIQIQIEKEVSEGVFLLIKVQEYPRIERTVFEGNDELSDKDVEQKIPFIRGQILKPQDVANLKQRLFQDYQKEGLLNAQIKPKYYSFFAADTLEDEIEVVWQNTTDLADEYKITYDSNDPYFSNLLSKIKDRILLKLEFTEGEATVVREIDFNGNIAFDDDDLKDAMDETSESVWWKFWNSAEFNPDDYEKDKETIINFYRKNGYRDADLISDSVQFYSNNEDMRIILNVFEGTQYKIRKIYWVGNTVYTADQLNERLEFKKGDIYDYERFEQNLKGNEKQSDIYAMYLDNGYLTFNLTPNESKVPPDSVDITIRMEERNQFRIGKVNIAGNDKTKDKVIRRELYTVPGDYFNRGFLFRSIQQLANLQYFNVEKLYGPSGITTKLTTDSTVDVGFNVEEKSSDYLNASVGYSGSFGFSGAVGITLTNFSIAEPFSLGGGQILSFNWQFGVGSFYRTFTIGFTEPWLFDTPTLAGFEVFDTRQQYIYDLRQSGGTFRLGRRLKWPDDFFYLLGRFKYQYNDVIEGQNFYAEGVTNQFTLGATLSRKNIDNPIFPSFGSNFSLDGEISGGPFLPGDVDYLKVSFTAEWYRKLFNSNRLVLYTVADLGYIDEIVNGTQIQPFEFYYMGGNGLVIATSPLRGYDDRTVGPRNANGDVIGGRVMMRYTTELRFAVALEPIPLYLLAFAEAGNAFENFDKTDIFNLRRSVGIGARIFINPLGLIGFDLGYGFDRQLTDSKDPAWLFHFQFGKGF